MFSEGDYYNIAEIVGAPVGNVISVVAFGNGNIYDFAIADATSNLFTIKILKGSGRVRINYRLV